MKKKYAVWITSFFVSAGSFITGCHTMPYHSVYYPETLDHTAAFDTDKVPYDRTGYVFQYKKSNQDGSFPADVWIYYPSKERSESFKIYRFSKLQHATDLVCADYDLIHFQPETISAYLVDKEGNRKLNAFSQYMGTDLTVTFHSHTRHCTMGITPSYNYNFDWADLNTMLPYLKKKGTDFEAGFLAPDNLARFKFAGYSRFRFTGQEEHDGKFCDVYEVKIQNHEKKPGHLYADAVNYDLVEINMSLPDNPGFNSFQFKLITKGKMTLDEWNSFILKMTRQTLKVRS
jgi:hypothetical protein